MEVIKTVDLRKTYKNGSVETRALNGIDLSLERGEFVSLVGPSGSGKSTLLHLIGGVDYPTKGKVYIDSVDIFSLSEDNLSIFRRRNIGFIFQFFNLIPLLTVEENILLPLLLDHRSYDRDFLKSLYETLDLGDKLGVLPGNLSGGEMQRVAIARALITKPSIILADEPTGNLDSKASQEVFDLLKLSSNKFNQTTLFITHDSQLAGKADRMIKMVDGRLIK